MDSVMQGTNQITMHPVIITDTKGKVYSKAEKHDENVVLFLMVFTAAKPQRQ